MFNKPGSAVWSLQSFDFQLEWNFNKFMTLGIVLKTSCTSVKVLSNHYKETPHFPFVARFFHPADPRGIT